MQAFSYFKTGVFALFSFFLVVSIISFPKEAMEASLRGLTIWWDIVFPSLLPFFITSELLIGFGVVRFLGILLEPLMRPLFRVPGAGGFVMSMGIASGYPMGAKLTVRLREQGLISKSEGERLVSITSTSGPLFMFGAVAVGFFHDVGLGLVIALSHYLGLFLVGMVMRFHDYREESEVIKPKKYKRNIFFRALQAMHYARLQDGRTLGTLLGEAVMSSIQTLMMVGGFIIIFSVMLAIMNIVGIQSLLLHIFSFVLQMLAIPTELAVPWVAGLFEITLGSKLASELSQQVPLIYKVAVAGGIIAWSGLSVHAQVASILAKTDIGYKPFLVSRLLHATFAMICTFLLWKPIHSLLQPISSGQTKAVSLPFFQSEPSIWYHPAFIFYSWLWFILLTGAILLTIRIAKYLAH